jgi:hypothetical protein
VFEDNHRIMSGAKRPKLDNSGQSDDQTDKDKLWFIRKVGVRRAIKFGVEVI